MNLNNITAQKTHIKEIKVGNKENSNNEKLPIVDKSISTKNEDVIGKNTYKGFLIGLFSVVLIHTANGLSIGCIQLLQEIPPDFQLSLFRFIMGLFYCVIYLMFRRILPKISRENVKFVVCLVLTSFIFNIFMYSHHLKELPVVTVLSTYSTFMLTFTLVLSRIFLKTKVKTIKVLIWAIALIGVTLIIVPKVWEYVEEDKMQNITFKNQHNKSTAYRQSLGENNNRSTRSLNCSYLNPRNGGKTMMTDKNNETEFFDGTQITTPLNGPNMLETYIIAVLYLIPAVIATVSKALLVAGTSLKEANLLPYAFWYLSVNLLISVVWTFTLENPFIPETLEDKLLCLGHASCAASGTFIQFFIFQYVEPNAYAIMSCFRLPIAFVIQTTFLKSVTHVEHLWMYLTGMVIVVFSSLITPLYEYFILKQSKGLKK